MDVDDGDMFVGPVADDIGLEPLGLITACYHRPSGRTHLLTEPAPEILTVLADNRMTRGALLARLRDSFDLESDAGQVDAALAVRLDELVATGLVTHVRGVSRA